MLSFVNYIIKGHFMIIRKALPKDADDLKILYFENLTNYPPLEKQDMDKWRVIIDKLLNSDTSYLLVAEVDGKAVSTVYLTVIINLTHNLRPFGVIENVVTHIDYRNRGYASALLNEATNIAKEHNCYKVFLETGSKNENTINFYRNNGFELDMKRSCLKRL